MPYTKATPSTTTEGGSPSKQSTPQVPLRSHAQANHTVDSVGEGAVSFQGVLDPATGKTQGYTQLIRVPDKGTWTTVFSNDIGRLEQGVGNCNKGTNAIFFIRRSGVPAGKRVTYGRIIVSTRPNKTETHRLCITVEGYKLSYEVPTATKFASLITTNILFDSVVSNILTMFMCADIHDFYYNTPMVDFEYMKLPLRMFPQDIVQQYNLKDLVATYCYVCMEISKGMPGLKNSGRLASDSLSIILFSRVSNQPTNQTSMAALHISYIIETFRIGMTIKGSYIQLLSLHMIWPGNKLLCVAYHW